jgi:tetratricopeptide (TPR) repeat protein
MAERLFARWMALAVCLGFIFICTPATRGRPQDPTGRPESKNKGKKPPKPLTPLTVILTVLTDPPGSQVLINGEDRGVSNDEGRLTLDKLPLGHYDVEVRKEGFELVKRGFEAGRDSPTLVFKLAPDFDSAAKEFDPLIAAGKLTGPDTPNAFELVSRLSNSFGDRPEVAKMRLALFDKLIDSATTVAKAAVLGWRQTERESIVRGRDAATAALALRGDDKTAGSREAFFQGLLALRDWQTAGDTPTKGEPGAEGVPPDGKANVPPGPGKARSLLEKSVLFDENWPLSQYELGLTLLILSDASAESHLIKAALSEPKWSLPHIALGDSYCQIKKYKESIGEYQKALSLEPNSAAALAALGLARFAKGDANAATKDLQRAIEMDPTIGLPHLNLGRVLAASKKSKDWVRAEDELKLAMQKNPHNLEFQNGSAEVLIADLQKRKKN